MILSKALNPTWALLFHLWNGCKTYPPHFTGLLWGSNDIWESTLETELLYTYKALFCPCKNSGSSFLSGALQYYLTSTDLAISKPVLELLFIFFLQPLKTITFFIYWKAITPDEKEDFSQQSDKVTIKSLLMLEFGDLSVTNQVEMWTWRCAHVPLQGRTCCREWGQGVPQLQEPPGPRPHPPQGSPHLPCDPERRGRKPSHSGLTQDTDGQCSIQSFPVGWPRLGRTALSWTSPSAQSYFLFLSFIGADP